MINYKRISFNEIYLSKSLKDFREAVAAMDKGDVVVSPFLESRKGRNKSFFKDNDYLCSVADKVISRVSFADIAGFSEKQKIIEIFENNENDSLLDLTFTNPKNIYLLSKDLNTSFDYIDKGSKEQYYQLIRDVKGTLYKCPSISLGENKKELMLLRGKTAVYTDINENISLISDEIYLDKRGGINLYTPSDYSLGSNNKKIIVRVSFTHIAGFSEKQKIIEIFEYHKDDIISDLTPKNLKVIYLLSKDLKTGFDYIDKASKGQYYHVIKDKNGIFYKCPSLFVNDNKEEIMLLRGKSAVLNQSNDNESFISGIINLGSTGLVGLFSETDYLLRSKNNKIICRVSFANIVGFSEKQKVIEIFDVNEKISYSELVIQNPKVIYLLSKNLETGFDYIEKGFRGQNYQLIKDKMGTFYKCLTLAGENKNEIMLLRAKTAAYTDITTNRSWISGEIFLDKHGRVNLYTSSDYFIGSNNKKIVVRVSFTDIVGFSEKQKIIEIFEYHKDDIISDLTPKNLKVIYLLSKDLETGVDYIDKGPKGSRGQNYHVIKDKNGTFYKCPTLVLGGNKNEIMLLRGKSAVLNPSNDRASFVSDVINLNKTTSLFNPNDFLLVLSTNQIICRVRFVDVTGFSEKQKIIEIFEYDKHNSHSELTLKSPKIIYVLSKDSKTGFDYINKKIKIYKTKDNQLMSMSRENKYSNKNKAFEELKKREQSGYGNNLLSMQTGRHADIELFEACRKYNIELPRMYEDSFFEAEYLNESLVESIFSPNPEIVFIESTVDIVTTKVNFMMHELAELFKIETDSISISKLKHKIYDLRNSNFGKDHSTLRQFVRLETPDLMGDDYNISNSCFENIALQDDKFQEAAVNIALHQKSKVILIQGGAGSGKTTVLCEIAHQFVNKDKRVLVVSHKNEAVDNLLIRLRNSGISIKRVGIVENIREELQEDIYKEEEEPIEAYVLGVTVDTLSMSKSLKNRKFDIVIMDEAGTINEVDTLIAASRAREKIIIAGDHFQLKPFRDHQFIKDRAEEFVTSITTSGMETLWDTGYPQVFLAKNYRCHPLISILLSRTIYGNKMVPKPWLLLEEDTIRVRDIKKDGNKDNEEKTTESRPLYLELNTKNKENTVNKNSYFNKKEAEAVIKEFEKAIASGYPIEEITILSQYNAQVDVIRHLLYDYLMKNYYKEQEIKDSTSMANGNVGIRRTYITDADIMLDKGLTLSKEDIASLVRNQVKTVQKYQGRDNSVVILSFVRSNKAPSEIGDIGDINNGILNVALSRSMDRLILVADVELLSNPKANAEGFRILYKELENIKKIANNLFAEQQKYREFSLRELIQYKNGKLDRELSETKVISIGDPKYKLTLDNEKLVVIEKYFLKQLKRNNHSNTNEFMTANERETIERLHASVMYGQETLSINSGEVGDLADNFPDIVEAKYVRNRANSTKTNVVYIIKWIKNSKGNYSTIKA